MTNSNEPTEESVEAAVSRMTKQALERLTDIIGKVDDGIMDAEEVVSTAYAYLIVATLLGFSAHAIANTAETAAANIASDYAASLASDQPE